MLIFCIDSQETMGCLWLGKLKNTSPEGFLSLPLRRSFLIVLVLFETSHFSCLWFWIQYYDQLSDQEDLIVWMRTAALPSFRKLYGRIEEDLKKDDVISVYLSNNYNTYSFGGRKKLVLSTANWLGGRNNFLGMAYIAVGSCSILLALVFLLLHLKNPRYTFISLLATGISARFIIASPKITSPFSYYSFWIYITLYKFPYHQC